jgi:hypothetical protein
MARSTSEARGGGKGLTILAVIAFCLWAGHDPAGALALLHHIAAAIASAASAASHGQGTSK